MKTVGIICEYNPFHLGHARQIRLIRETFGSDTRIVCIMSGNYVQRGEPAMWDKYTRAKAASLCGADVVLELPITGVLQSAEGFARCGIDCLNRFGGIDYLSFGTETADANQLVELAKRTLSDEFLSELHTYLDEGLPYAAARQKALHDEFGILSHPNNILGLEYCRALLVTNSSMRPFVVHRNGDYHASDADAAAPSATAVRKLYPSENWTKYVPENCSAVLQDAPWYQPIYGERAVLARLRGMSDEQWKETAHGSEGLWSKAMKAVRTEADFEQIIQSIKSKRYPRTRIQRLLLCAYLGITEKNLSLPISYVRILAFTQNGRALLRSAKNRGEIELVNPGQTPQNNFYFTLDTRCSDLFTLFSVPSFPCHCRMEQDARIF